MRAISQGKNEGKRARGQEGKRARGQEGKRARGQEGKRARGQKPQTTTFPTQVILQVLQVILAHHRIDFRAFFSSCLFTRPALKTCYNNYKQS